MPEASPGTDSTTTDPTSTDPTSVAIQSILFHTSVPAVERTLATLDHSARIGKAEGSCTRVEVLLGDASRAPLLDSGALAGLRDRLTSLDRLEYVYFDDNVGTAKGHNALARLSDSELLVTSNPDIVPDARALWRMAAAFADPSVGMVEAKQLPFEHPKEYDEHTGHTSWAATAFAMTRRSVFEAVGGFDEQTFFMYCDDVDYSWLVREAGLHVVFLPSAVVFHDKELSVDGRWQPTGAERFFSAQAALLLAHKWSREDLVAEILDHFEVSEVEDERRAAEEFRRRRAEGLLVPQRDPAGSVGTFVAGAYAEHRFAL
ncbi:glycosyltransferase family 2 protein [Nocardioides houyundeii]|uniref:glycosyltransferase family 2 protein n=1 Tax=Nocardioides houyundeii TaxID=2045452 RepID=UPI0013157793|nr:glycosyltransferase family 2 protein [Nocardioides houyundeii]